MKRSKRVPVEKRAQSIARRWDNEQAAKQTTTASQNRASAAVGDTEAAAPSADGAQPTANSQRPVRESGAGDSAGATVANKMHPQGRGAPEVTDVAPKTEVSERTDAPESTEAPGDAEAGDNVVNREKTKAEWDSSCLADVWQQQRPKIRRVSDVCCVCIVYMYRYQVLSIHCFMLIY